MIEKNNPFYREESGNKEIFQLIFMPASQTASLGGVRVPPPGHIQNYNRRVETNATFSVITWTFTV